MALGSIVVAAPAFVPAALTATACARTQCIRRYGRIWAASAGTRCSSLHIVTAVAAPAAIRPSFAATGTIAITFTAAPSIMTAPGLPLAFPMAAMSVAPAMAPPSAIINIGGIAGIIEAIIPAIGPVIILEDAAITIAVSGDIAGIFAILVQIAILVITFVGIVFAGVAIAIIAGAIAIIDGAG